MVVEVALNGKRVTMEVDTGAAMSLILEYTYRKYLRAVPLAPTDLQLHTHTDEKLEVQGKCSVSIEYRGQVAQVSIYVVAGRGPSLLGRDILQSIKLDWVSIFKLQSKTKTDLSRLLDKYAMVFSDTLGTFAHHEATQHLKGGATPKYFRPRSIPFALKNEVERIGFLSGKVSLGASACEWASPIVVVPKKDGHIRLCGDYKVTINPLLTIDSHPLPKPQELFASLAGGERFTKLDLSQAYQQMRLDQRSKELVTINTH